MEKLLDNLRHNKETTIDVSTPHYKQKHTVFINDGRVHIITQHKVIKVEKGVYSDHGGLYIESNTDAGRALEEMM